MKQLIFGLSALIFLLIVLFIFVLFSPPATPMEVQVLDVRDGKGELAINPSTIYVDVQRPTKIQVNTSLKLNCQILNLDVDVSSKTLNADVAPPSKTVNWFPPLGGSAAPVLKLSTDDKKNEAVKRGEVKIEPVSSPPEWPWHWIAAVFSLVIAGLSFIQFRRSSNQSLVNELPGIQARIAALSDRVRPSQAPVGSKTATPGPALGVGTVQTQPTLQQRTAQFLAAADAWCRAAKNSSNEQLPWPVTSGLEEIRGTASQPVYSKDVQQRLRELVISVTKVALNHSDSMLDPKFQNNGLQILIEQLVQKADVTLIKPQPLERVNDKFHHIAGRQPGSADSQRGRISNVVRRGLQSNQSTVICQAEVNIYD